MDLKVFIIKNDSQCGECGRELIRSSWITLAGEKGVLCLSCADLDHLVFLPPGDAALTRRAHKHSRLSAVVLEWSRTRKRYERQGILVEEAALEQGEQECLADQDARERRKEREAARRERLDQAYVEKFARRIREIYPNCPQGVEKLIAEHACQKYSGRVGRTEAAKNLEEEAIDLAVKAHIRHNETPYDKLLLEGIDRHEARVQVSLQVRNFLQKWKS
jgi:hypothetical protein